MEKSSAIFRGDAEHVLRSYRTHTQSFNRKPQILWRAGGRGEVEYIIDRAGIEGLADILLLELEARFAGQVLHVFAKPCGKIIDADNRMPFSQQAIG